MALLDELDKRRESADRNRENSARLAQSYAVFTTTGQGSEQYGPRVDFGLTFIEEPVVSYGSFVDVDDLADLLNTDDSDDTTLPLCSGFVVNWDQDDRGFYVGCWLAVRVYFPPPTTGSTAAGDAVPVDPMAQPSIKHHFTFAALGIKDVTPLLTDGN